MPSKSTATTQLNWFTANPKLTTVLFFILMLAVIALTAYQRIQVIIEGREQATAERLQDAEMRLAQVLRNTQNIALTIALTLDQSGKPQNFEAVAAEVLAGNPVIQAVELVPQGKIAYIYPLVGNTDAIGLDLFRSGDYNGLESMRAVTLRQMYFQGPMRLKQGEMGVIGRIPLFLKKEFWGFSAVVIQLDSLLKEAGINNNHEYYKFQFSKVNPVTDVEEFFLGDTKISLKANYAIKKIEDGNWNIYLTDTRSIYTDRQLMYLVLLGSVIAVLSGVLLLRILRRQLALHLLVDKKISQLTAAESKYKTIFDKAAIGIGRIDSLTGQFLEANPFLCQLLGYTAEELTTKKIKSLIHPDDLAADAQKFKSLLAGEIREFSSMRRYIHKDEQVTWTTAIVSPLWNEGEAPSNHLVIVHDISQQVAYETELIASKKHVEDLVNSIEGIVWEADIKDGFVNTFLSSKIYDILGYTLEECSESQNFILENIYEEDREIVSSYIKTELFKKRHHIFEYRMIAKDGSLVWISDSLTVEPNLEFPEKLRGIMIDITSVKEAEVTLQKSFDIVTEQNKRLLNFSYIVSHNLRSHVSNIDGITALIKASDSEKERNQMIDLLSKVVGNLNDTLYNLNKIIDIQTSINLVREPLNLNEYVNNALRTQEAQIINIKAEIHNNVPNNVFVYFNKAYLESVLLNLISNAVRYSHPCRIPVIEIFCEYDGENGHILTVKDNGVGIDMVRNGDKLFGLNQTFYGNNGARGFGLFITKNQIEAMGNHIEVESELDKGSVFKIYFN